MTPKIESRVAAVASAQGLSITTLARSAELDRGTVRRLWRHEMPRFVRFSTVTKICHALGDTQPGQLFVLIDD